jgi:hypothetical protein
VLNLYTFEVDLYMLMQILCKFYVDFMQCLCRFMRSICRFMQFLCTILCAEFMHFLCIFIHGYYVMYYAIFMFFMPFLCNFYACFMQLSSYAYFYAV